MRVSRCLLVVGLVAALAACSATPTTAPTNTSTPAPSSTTSSAAPTKEQLRPDQVEAGLRRAVLGDAALDGFGYTVQEPFKVATTPLAIVSTCGGEVASNSRIYHWVTVKSSRGSSTLYMTAAHYELMTAAEAIEQVRALITCGSYQQPDGLTLTLSPAATPLPPSAGVDGQLSYCETTTVGIARCSILLAHDGYASVTGVVAADEETSLAMLSELAPDLTAALLTA